MSRFLTVFDPAMCCSTGVCGPSIDPALIKLASDIAFLKRQGVEVERFNLAHHPEAFTNSPLVLSEMGAEAENLPIFVVDGKVMARATYPNREELGSWFGIEPELTREKPRAKLTMAQSDR